MLVVAELADLLLSLAHCGWGRQGLGDGLAAPLVGKEQAWSMARIVELGAMASWFAATRHRADDGVH